MVRSELKEIKNQEGFADDEAFDSVDRRVSRVSRATQGGAAGGGGEGSKKGDGGAVKQQHARTTMCSVLIYEAS